MEKLSLEERIARLPLGAQEVVNTCAELLSAGNKADAVAAFKEYVFTNSLTIGETVALENFILEKKKGMEL